MRKSKVSKSISLVLALMMFVVVFAGCGTEKADVKTDATAQSTSTAAEAALEPVELSWYLDCTPPTDVASVEEAANKLMKDKLNATIKLNFIDWGSYDDKMKLLIASGESFDLCFTSAWVNLFAPNVARGAFLPLNDLLDKYGPDIKATIPEKLWAGASSKGKIYAVINYQIEAARKGYSIRKDLLDKYKFDISNIKKPADIEPFLKLIKDNEVGITPYLSDPYSISIMNTFESGWLFESIATQATYYRVKDPEFKVINILEQPEIVALLKERREWYNKGYLRKDAMSIKDLFAEVGTGKYAVIEEGSIKPGGVAEFKTKFGYEVVQVPIENPYVPNGASAGTLTSISASSENPERAMMFLNELFANKELANTFMFGVEGKHYTKNDDGTISVIEDGGYNPGISWQMGNQFNAFYTKGQELDTWDQTIKLNNEAEASPIDGFTFDSEPVKADVSKVDAVYSEFVTALSSGGIDTDKLLTNVNKKLKDAGIDNVIAEMQKQLNAFKGK